ncbi:Uncharacterized beta-barrel protein YwiB, DUF1934 family [Selenomonas sp. WCT3]|nr:DUF1934 domain-containing protein [Selenomonas sp.]SDG35467.1 Uncharacterized beta-barrel protein YwiB, DUF1934 family [Selenomonas ruminantium]
MSAMNPVVVRVRGSQRDDSGEENTIESMAIGRHSVKNGKHYVLYEDALLDEKVKTSTVLKFSAEEVVILRKGGVHQEMRFREGAETSSTYRTPYGDLKLSIRTSRLRVNLGLLEGRIEAEYDIAIDGRYQSSNTLQVQITNDKKQND